MKKLSVLAAIVMAAMMTACGGGQSADGEASALAGDSAVVNAPLAQQEVEEMTNVINALSACMDSIQVQENLLFKTDENATKQQVLERLRAFKELLARKEAEIAKLKANNKSNNATIANLAKLTEYLKGELEAKTKQIEKLTEAVETKDAKISELRYNLNAISAEREYLADQNYQQDQQLNQVFYIVASKQELKDMGLATGGFLKKTKADYANMDQTKFKKKDMRGFTKLTIDSKKPKLLTEKPADSYTLVDNGDGTSTLSITNAKAFWAASPYLIIQK